MRRRRWDAWFRFHVSHHFEAETLHEVRPGAVIRHDLGALVRSHGRVPALLGGRKTRVEVVVALGEERLVRRRELAQLIANGLCDPASIARLEPVMRIAGRVHVTHGARDLGGRYLQDADVLRGIEVTVGTRLDLRVAAAVEERRQPADLQLAADRDIQVGAAHRQDEARLRLHEVRILIALRERGHRHLVATDLAGDRPEVFGRRNDVQLALRVCGRCSDDSRRYGQRDDESSDSHKCSNMPGPPRRDVHRARQWKT